MKGDKVTNVTQAQVSFRLPRQFLPQSACYFIFHSSCLLFKEDIIRMHLSKEKKNVKARFTLTVNSALSSFNVRNNCLLGIQDETGCSTSNFHRLQTEFHLKTVTLRIDD